MKPARPRGRVIACLLLIVLGVFAAARLELGYLPSATFPEIGITLALEEAGDLEALTREWVMPIEAAVRAAGESRSLVGEVHPRGAVLHLWLAPGVDPERKVARLESELSRLRARLRDRGSLWLWPAASGGDAGRLVLWLDGEWPPAERREVRAALLALEAVRAVTVVGEGAQTLRIVPRPGSGLSAAELESALAEASRERRVGARAEVSSGSALAARGIERLPVIDANADPPRVHPLAALAGLSLSEAEPEWRARLDGRDGFALLVDREPEATPLALRRSVERVLEAGAWERRALIVSDESEPLARLARRILAGLLAGTAIAAVLGFAQGGASPALGWMLVLPVAGAASLNAFLLAARPLDVTSLPLGLIGLTAALATYGLRAAGSPARTLVAWLVVCSALPLVSVHLTGGPLAPLLDAPARAFLLAAASSALAGLLPPVFAAGAGARWLRGARGLLRSSLRQGATLALFALTACWVLLALGGSALAPRAGTLSPPFGDLALEVGFAEGTTLEQAGAWIAVIEDHLDPGDEIERVWSLWNEERGSITVDVRRDLDGRARLQRIARRLELQLARLPVALRVSPLLGSGAGGRPLRFRERRETEPEVDEDAIVYRFVLRSPRLDSLVRAEERVRERLARFEVREDELLREWGAPGIRVELVPRPEAAPGDVERATARLVERLRWPPARSWPGEPDVLVQVRSAAAPASPDAAPAIETLDRIPVADVLDGDAAAAPLVPTALFRVEHALTPPRVLRENGRYALPLDLRLRGNPPRRHRLVPEIDRSLAQLALGGSVAMAGIEMERPVPERRAWRSERWRMLLVVAALPFLLLVAAVIRLDSVSVGILATVPGVLGVAATTPLLAGAGGADELTLLALGAMLCVALPVGWELAARGSGQPARDLHRATAPLLPGLVGALGSALAMLAATAIGLAGDRWAWVTPSWGAAVAGGVTLLASATVLPVLLVGWADWRSGRTREGRARARPAAWRGATDAGSFAGVLAARSLTKVYGGADGRARRGGLWALRGIDFELEPGIVGLLGPNGAGKTTLLRLLSGLLEPTRGQVRFRGVPITSHNLPSYRRLVGFLPQGFNAYEGFNGRDFLDYWALERGLAERSPRAREIDRVLELVGLEQDADRRVRDLSGGMRRRLGIARALLGDPPILIVDEPTTGLDVAARNQLRRSLLQVAERRIILFSTHLASDVAAAAARILVLHLGRLRYDGSAAGLVERARGRVASLLVPDEELAATGRRHLVTTRVRTPRGVLVRLVLGAGQPLPADAGLVEPNLEEAYLALVAESGEPARDAFGARTAALDWIGADRAREDPAPPTL